MADDDEEPTSTKGFQTAAEQATALKTASDVDAGDKALSEAVYKQRGGEESAKSNLIAHPRSEYAHKRPVTD